mgnify:CR=1 FL=1
MKGHSLPQKKQLWKGLGQGWWIPLKRLIKRTLWTRSNNSLQFLALISLHISRISIQLIWLDWQIWRGAVWQQAMCEASIHKSQHYGDREKRNGRGIVRRLTVVHRRTTCWKPKKGMTSNSQSKQKPRNKLRKRHAMCFLGISTNAETQEQKTTACRLSVR